MAGTINMGARREVLAVVAERYRATGRREKGRILDELCATTGWHRKHALRALSRSGSNASAEERAARQRGRKYDGDQGCSDSAMGSIRPGVRQAARGDDPDTSAGA